MKTSAVGFSQFSTDTSLHGVKHISGGSRGFRRTFWTLALVGMLAALVCTVWDQVYKFTSYPFYTVSMLKQTHNMPFPAVTVCNNNQFRQSFLGNNTMAQHAIRLMYDKGPKRPKVNLSDPMFDNKDMDCDPRQFFSDASHQLDIMFRYCSWMEAKVNCSHVFTPIMTDFGNCYTFNSPQYIAQHGQLNTTLPGDSGGLTVLLDIERHEYYYGIGSSAGIKVLVHEPSDVPNVRNHGFLVAPGTKAHAATSVTKVRCLPPPYKAMGDEECLDTDASGFKTPLKFYDTYDMKACYLECAARQTMKECGCQDVFDRAKNVTYCGIRKLIQCYFPTRAKNQRSPSIQSKCGCKRQCSWNQYDVSVSSASFPLEYDIKQYMENRNITRQYVLDNYLELSVFYQQMVYTDIQQVPAYNAVDIVGNLGGQLGIFLGASFLTLTEVAEYLLGLLRSFCCKPKKTEVQAWTDKNTTGNPEKPPIS